MSWVERVEAVLAVLKESSIEEIELAEGGFEMILRRSPGNVVRVEAQRHAIHSPQQALADYHTASIKAPLTGVYYAKPSPDTEPFVQVGENVAVGQTIALIEAMKVFNEIQAEVAGKVTAIQVQNGDVVKKDQVMLQVAPAG